MIYSNTKILKMPIHLCLFSIGIDPALKRNRTRARRIYGRYIVFLLVGCKLHVVSSSGVIFADFSIILVGIFKSASTVVGNYYTNLFAILCDVINDEVDKNERENAV